MNVAEYFESLSAELSSLKNRVRNFIGTHHLPTDGEWKESVLRTVLKRHTPNNVEVGRGFVVDPGRQSRQIDVLIYDASKPILYKDGDLVFITGDTVKGIIEVKTTVDNGHIRGILDTLADNAEFIYDSSDRAHDSEKLFVGLFSYDTDIDVANSMRILRKLKDVARESPKRIINHLSLGSSFFIRFWEASPYREDNYNKWHSYDLPNRAPGYFINNVIDSVARHSVSINQDVWFPAEAEGKEYRKLEECPLYEA